MQDLLDRQTASVECCLAQQSMRISYRLSEAMFAKNDNKNEKYLVKERGNKGYKETLRGYS